MKANNSSNKKIISITDRDIDKYFKDRLENKINVYKELGNKYKWIYWITASISMICAALVPVLINYEGLELWATILSLIVTILVGLQGVIHPREHWRNYDTISANLRKEEMLFSTKTDDYKGEIDEERFQLLVKRVEELITQERKETIIMRTSENDKPPK